jgi:hypothetical protein
MSTAAYTNNGIDYSNSSGTIQAKIVASDHRLTLSGATGNVILTGISTDAADEFAAVSLGHLRTTVATALNTAKEYAERQLDIKDSVYRATQVPISLDPTSSATWAADTVLDGDTVEALAANLTPRTLCECW